MGKQSEIDWTKALDELRGSSNRDVDDIIDEVTERITTDEPSSDMTQFLVEAVGRAQSDLSLKSAALNLALIADADDYDAVKLLTGAYEQAAGNPYLGPALLDALGVLALRSVLARSAMSTQLLLLQRNGDEHLLIRAIKWIGRLDAVRVDSDLASKLDEFLKADSLFVRTEARQQRAMMTFRGALLARNRAEMSERLVAARAEFARAWVSDENRPDSRSLVLLVDMMLAFTRLGREQGSLLPTLKELSVELKELLLPNETQGWWDYRSDLETMRAMSILRISDALIGGARSANEADEWMNISDALEGLARLYALIRTESLGLTNSSFILDGASDMIYAESLGPLLVRAVNFHRLEVALDRHVIANGEDEISQGLRALLNGARATTFETNSSLSVDLNSAIAQLADRNGTSAGLLMEEFKEAIDGNTLAQWAEKNAGLLLVVERPDLYGGDPAIDEVVRPLLRKLRDDLKTYDPLKWTRLVSLLTSIVGFVKLVQDIMPAYVRRLADNGMGQGASEDYLQENLYESLRREFGTKVDYESVRVGGGRPDILVKFPEVRFPIEVKHEFYSVDSDHIRKNYLYQADFYAAATDRVSFLMILDLRPTNAGDVTASRSVAYRTDSLQIPNPLYHLMDCFRVEAVDPDPDMPNAMTKAVVIGFVQGNRPLPSSMSSYSRRPRSKKS